MWQEIKDEIRRGQALFDRKIEKWVESYGAGGGRIYCGKGCAGCCNLTVNATYAEALLVAERLSPDQAGSLAEYAARLSESVGEVSDLKSYLKMHRKKIGFCPFLGEDGACGVYEARPFSCRSLLATRPSDWCGVDFGELPDIEKELFMSSLDRRAVSFPTHYVADTQETGREMESEAAWRMKERFGFSLSGALPFLVYLETEHRLSETIERGREATLGALEEQGLNLPFLLIWGE